MSLNNGMDKDSSDQFGRPFNQWLNRTIKKLTTRPPAKPAEQKQEVDDVAQFIGEFERDPQGTYKKYSARQISDYMAEADKRGLMSPARRTKIWDSVQPEKIGKDAYDEGRRERMRAKADYLPGYPPKK